MNIEQVQSLLHQYGSPLYVFDVDGFCANYRRLTKAMTDVYPRYQLAYSYKTNYTPYICKLVKELGGYAEVVSDMEYQVAKHVGYADSEIIYNGPAKGPLMEQFLLDGGILNIDNEEEAERVIATSKAHPEAMLKVGIRINTDIGAGFVSRFGLEVDSVALDYVIKKLKQQPNIRLVGLHMHVSRARGLQAWKHRIDNILETADKYIEGMPEYIDLGSGMFAEMEDYLRSQFKVDIPSYADYAEVVAGTMAKHYADCEEKPYLVTEPGTTVVSRYLSLLTTVTSIKSLRGKNFAVVDSDYHNAGETCRMMKVPYSHYSTGESENVIDNPDIVGYTCLEQDRLFEKFPEKVRVGDIIELRNIGGYSVVYKPPFIRPNCAMVAVKDGSPVSLIKRAETFEDIFHTYIF